MKKLILIGAIIAALASAGAVQAKHVKQVPFDTTIFDEMGD